MNRLLLMVLRNLVRLPGLYGKLCHYAKHTDDYPEQEKFDHIAHIMDLAIKSGNVNLTVTGTEHIPQEGGCLMYGNHQGIFDVFAVGVSSPRPVGAVFKIELSNVPLVKQIIACTKSYAMDRSDVRQSLTVIQDVTEEVKGGRVYLIFPEGTRSKQGNTMGPFHAGSFRAAVKAKCPVVPLAFIDSFKVLDQAGSKPVSVQLHYLEPICYEEYKDMKAAELAELVRSRIEKAVAERSAAS